MIEMFTYFGYKGCLPRLRLKSGNNARGSRKLSLQDKRKRNISEPMPIDKTSAAVQRFLSYNDNNNALLPADVSSLSESPCHRGFNRLYISETSSIVTEYPNVDSDSTDESVFTSPREEQTRRNSVCAFYPPKPPRMKQKRTFMCQNRGCGNTDYLLGRIQAAFKSCSFCFTHYCSAKCQNENAKEHMKICFYGNADAKVKELSLIIQENDISYLLSELAWEGYKKKGRGCLFMILPSLEKLEEFLKFKMAAIKSQPTYSGIPDVQKCCVSNRYRQKLLKTISTYNPATHLIVNIAVVIGRRIPNNPVPRSKDVTVRKIALVKMHEDFRLTPKEILVVKECTPLPRKADSVPFCQESRRKSI